MPVEVITDQIDVPRHHAGDGWWGQLHDGKEKVAFQCERCDRRVSRRRLVVAEAPEPDLPKVTLPRGWSWRLTDEEYPVPATASTVIMKRVYELACPGCR